MKLMYLIILFGMLFICCSKEESISYLKPGCKPSLIILDEPLLGGYEDNYYYDNNKLTGFGNFDYTYENDKVSRINLGLKRYEEYEYNDQNNVIVSRQYRKVSEEEGFKIVSHFKYTYTENQISYANEIIDNKEYAIYRSQMSSNIDSILTYSANGDILVRQYYTYDDKPNIYINLCTPKFNFFWLIDRTTKNNVIKYDKYEPSSVSPYFGTTKEIIYNDFDFPEEIISNSSSGIESRTYITYIKCE